MVTDHPDDTQLTEQAAEEADLAESAERTYAPPPRHQRRGVVLCLSGGGYRAVLFHLGGLRRLNELGVLSSVTTVSSVSGGSIVAAHIATAIATGTLTWPGRGEVIRDWNEAVTAPLVAFTRRNIRSPAILHRLRPDNWIHDYAGVQGLAAQYHRHLTQLPLRQLPTRPRFILSATDLAFGVNWIFDSGACRTGDYQAGYTALPEWPLARAVATSSCFPPVFNPLPVHFATDQLADGSYTGPDRESLIRSIRLTDGGVYANMGLEPVWKTRQTVLVSDGGPPSSPTETGDSGGASSATFR